MKIYRPLSERINKAEWHGWYAWHPVRIGDHLIWLEWVLRKGEHFEDSCGGGWSYEYDTPAA